MGNILEKLWPMIKYLVDRSVLIPTLVIVAIVAGYKYEYLTGDNGMYCAVAVAVLVIVSRIFNKKG